MSMTLSRSLPMTLLFTLVILKIFCKGEYFQLLILLKNFKKIFWWYWQFSCWFWSKFSEFYFSRNWKVTRMCHSKLGLVNFLHFQIMPLTLVLNWYKFTKKWSYIISGTTRRCKFIWKLLRKIEKLKKKIKPDQARSDFLVPGVPSGLGPPQR